MTDSFEKLYPNISRWIQNYGWIEIGITDYFANPFVKALDEGGMVWEGHSKYETLDDALRDLEKNLTDHLRKRFGRGQS